MAIANFTAVALVASSFWAQSCLPNKSNSATSSQRASVAAGCDAAEKVISSLKVGSTLPPSFKACQSTKLAEVLVRTLSVRDEGLGGDEFRSSRRVHLDVSRHGNVFNADAYQIEIRFNPFIVDKVIENGVLNQHQVGASLSASVNPENRAQIEDHLIGIKLEDSYQSGMKNPLNELRPKYGYLNPAIEAMRDPVSGKEKMVYFRNSELDAYGCVVFRFKKDINLRSTWTFGDSLAQFDEIAALQTRVTGPFWYDPPRTLLKRSNAMPTVKEGRDIKYLEAQVWGALTIKHVESILISKGCGLDGIDSTPDSQAELMSLLKRSKLPIFRIGDGVVDRKGVSIPPRLKALGNMMPPDRGFLSYVEKIQ